MAQVLGVMLISSEGFPLMVALDSNLDEEQTAAISSQMLFWGEKLSEELNQGEINRIILEGAEGYCILVNCQHEIFWLNPRCLRMSLLINFKPYLKP